jgi:hemoglobin
MKVFQNQDDLYLLVAEFYKKNYLLIIPYDTFFSDAVKIHLEEHLPILVTFWSSALLGTGGYIKN